MALGDLVDPPVRDDNEVFIRNFKEGSTRVRFMPAVGKKLKGSHGHEKLVEVYGTEAWPSEAEHYIKGFGYAPCVAPHGVPCGPCTDPSEQVRKRNRSWYMNALDEAGEVRVFRMGVTLKDLLEGRESRHPSGPQGQPLSRRDYIIHHIGSGLGSTYDPETPDDGAYEIDFSEVIPHDIPSILEGLAERARELYDLDDAEPVLGPDQVEPSPVTTTKAPAGRIVPKTKKEAEPEKPAARIAPKKAAAKLETAKRVVEQEPDIGPDQDDYSTWGDHPDESFISGAETPMIRGWLESLNVDLPARANRALLVKTALAVTRASDEEPPY